MYRIKSGEHEKKHTHTENTVIRFLITIKKTRTLREERKNRGKLCDCSRLQKLKTIELNETC